MTERALSFVRTGADTLVVGMLLWGNFSGDADKPLDTIWTVTSVGKKSATVIALVGGMQAKASLRCATVPEGWQALDNKTLSDRVRECLDFGDPA